MHTYYELFLLFLHSAPYPNPPPPPHTPPCPLYPDVGDDDYWHQQKTFRMLEQMCADHVDDFDWFVRAVDDTYIKVDRLLRFLSLHDKRDMVSPSTPRHSVTSQSNTPTRVLVTS